MWDDITNDQEVRPVYHAWASLTRHTEPGDPVFAVQSSDPGLLAASMVGNALFWVSEAYHPQEVTIQGTQATSVNIMTLGTLQGERETGVTQQVVDNQFVAPPRSFGVVFCD